VLVLIRIINLGARTGWVVTATFRPHYVRERDPLPTVQEAAYNSRPVWIGKTIEIISKSESMCEYRDCCQLFLHLYGANTVVVQF